ncbi:MAG: hypothetical protein P8R45_05395, partial [Candidatus Binatia bacterium]|nr:hypothetical protein [Candidatus Binatia bacterium]
GKTGTTNEYRDAWFIGYTPELLVGVWVGYDGGTPLELSGGSAALPIWTEFMRRATAADKPRGFSVPPGVTLVEVDRRTGLPPLPPSDLPEEGPLLPKPEPVFSPCVPVEPIQLIREAFLTGDEPEFSSPLAPARIFDQALEADDLPEERLAPRNHD